MNVAIWGTKKEAIYLLNEIEESRKGNVICFIENDKKKWGNYIGEKPIYSFEQFRLKYHKRVEKVILALRNGHSIACILKQLKAFGIKNVGLLKPEAFDFGEKINIEKNSDQIVWIDMLNKPLLPYLQVILIKTCNLNCMGCTHFANLYNKAPEKNNIYDFKEFSEDMRRISENAKVFRLRLLGGEPLLYPYLKEAVEVAREQFPNADIRVVTNGLLLLRAPGELLQSLHNNKIGIDISPYKPTAEVIDQISSVLQQFKVNYNFEGVEDEYIKMFEKNISLDNEGNCQKSFEACPSKQCLTLMHGKLYKCPFEALAYKFFEYFSLKGNYGDGYDIRKADADYEEVSDNLYMYPAEACKFCSDRVERFEWRNTLNPQCMDWVVSYK